MSLQYSPYGFVKRKRQYSKLKLTPELQAEIYSRAVFGTSALLLMAGLAATGADDGEDALFDISGSLPFDTKKRNALIDSGRPEYSVKLFGYWISYKLNPVLIPFSILGNMMDTYKYGKGTSIFGKIGYGTLRGLTAVMDQTVATALVEFTELFDFRKIQEGKGIDDMIGGVEKFAIRMAKGAAIPNYVNDIDRIIDTKVYDKQDALEIAVREIPIARSIFGKQMRGTLGQPIEYAGVGKYLEKIGVPVKNRTEYTDIYSFMTKNDIAVILQIVTRKSMVVK